MSLRTRATVHDTLPSLLPSYFPSTTDSSGPDLAPLVGRDCDEVVALIGSPDFDSWSEALSRVGNCSRPVRLWGRSTTVDSRTGDVVSTYDSEQEPLGVTHIRCGNRRAIECPSCSRLYAADMFQLIRAGVVGGKTVPESVAENPLVFATVTAPSFGVVHGRRDAGRRCHPHAHGGALCEHGKPRTCHSMHADGDPVLGQPLCGDCYDYRSHVVWQWWAPELWKRFTIALRRQVAKVLGAPATGLPEVATVHYAKVAEFQVRGVVHFHALIRLDGPLGERFGQAPRLVDAKVLARAVADAAASVRLTVPGVDEDDPARILAFGRQLDARPVRASRRTDDPDEALSPAQVAGYLAKYATKSASDSGDSHSRHHRRIRGTVRDLAARATEHESADDAPYRLLQQWTHMLGFRGHFATKSRNYSVTLTSLRRARRRAASIVAAHRADGRPLDLAALEADLLADDAEETTLVIGQWHFVGMGWANDAQVLLARAAAARAREYDQWRAQERKNQSTSGDRTR